MADGCPEGGTVLAEHSVTAASLASTCLKTQTTVCAKSCNRFGGGGLKRELNLRAEQPANVSGGYIQG